jgi:hypothetical protein
MNVDVTITNKENPKITYHFYNTDMQMAPNFNFNFNFNFAIPTSIQGELKGKMSEPIKFGRYKIKMTVMGDKDSQGKYQTQVNHKLTNYKYKWTFEKEFNIGKEEVQKLNRTDVSIKKELNINLIIGIVIVVLLIIGFIYFKKNRKI